MKLIASGAHSDVFKDFSPQYGKIIIKRPKELYKNYIEKQLKGYKIIEELTKINENIGVNLPYLISIDRSNNQITEKFIDGKEFDKKIYDSLSLSDQNAVAYRLALFLHFMHNLHQVQPATGSIKEKFDKGSFNSAGDMIDIFENRLSEDLIKLVIDADNYLLNTNTSDEVQVLTHKDLRSQNILFDKKSKEITVIDFELAGQSNIYDDFIPYAPCSIISWDLTKKIINHYNNIKGNNIFIDLEKVRSALIYGSLNEYARVYKLHYDEVSKLSEKEKNNRVKLIEKRLSTFNKNPFELAKDSLNKKIVSNLNIVKDLEKF